MGVDAEESEQPQLLCSLEGFGKDQLVNILDSMEEAVAVWNAEDQLVFCNRAYRTLLGSVGFDVHPGVRFSDLVGTAVTTKLFVAHDSAEENQDNIEKRLAQHRRGRTRMVRQIRDGRWLRTGELKTKEGYTVTLHTDITELKKAEQQLKHIALHDELTGLANRNLFNRHLKRRLEVYQRDNRPLGVMMMDLDGFKHVNDTWGHAAGDVALRSVADRLREAIRTSDTLARLGGDEFALVAETDVTLKGMERLGARLVSTLDTPIRLEGDTETRLGLSLGIAICPDCGSDKDTLTRAADAACYRAKRAGGGVAVDEALLSAPATG